METKAIFDLLGKVMEKQVGTGKTGQAWYRIIVATFGNSYTLYVEKPIHDAHKVGEMIQVQGTIDVSGYNLRLNPTTFKGLKS